MEIQPSMQGEHPGPLPGFTYPGLKATVCTDPTDLILNLTRELTKAQAVLLVVDRALTAEAEANAAKHLSKEVNVSPLASKVKSVLHGLGIVLAEEAT